MVSSEIWDDPRWLMIIWRCAVGTTIRSPCQATARCGHPASSALAQSQLSTLEYSGSFCGSKSRRMLRSLQGAPSVHHTWTPGPTSPALSSSHRHLPRSPSPNPHMRPMHAPSTSSQRWRRSPCHGQPMTSSCHTVSASCGTPCTHSLCRWTRGCSHGLFQHRASQILRFQTYVVAIARSDLACSVPAVS